MDELKKLLHNLVEHFGHLTPQLKGELHEQVDTAVKAVQEAGVGSIQDVVNAVDPVTPAAPATDAAADKPAK